MGWYLFCVAILVESKLIGICLTMNYSAYEGMFSKISGKFGLEAMFECLNDTLILCKILQFVTLLRSYEIILTCSFI